MEYDTGLKGPVNNSKDEWDIEYNNLNQQLKIKKVITEEIWQERVNPLIPPDGLFEEDIEILQYIGGQKQKENSGAKRDLKEEDISAFKRARKDMVHKEEAQLTVKILPKKRLPSAPLTKLKASLKIQKKPFS